MQNIDPKRGIEQKCIQNMFLKVYAYSLLVGRRQIVTFTFRLIYKIP